MDRPHPRTSLTWLLIGASALLLTAIQPPTGWSALAWVAYVPFVLACDPRTSRSRLALAAYLVSTVYWLGNLHWLLPITGLGAVAFCVYTGLIWPLLALAIQACRKRGLAMALACPILVVGAEHFQGFALGGFSWRFLAHSQYQNLVLIQMVDLAGAAGLSFLIAMVNGGVADFIFGLSGRRLFRVWAVVESIVMVAAIVTVAVYGRWRIAQSYDTVTPGPKVAAVQSNIPQSVKDTFQASDQIFKDILNMSQACAQAGADMVAWPETMVQVIMDPELRPTLSTEEFSTATDQAIRAHAKDTCYVLFGGYGGHYVLDQTGEPKLDRYNSAFLYRPDGTQDPSRYDKIHLVLFGEYVPFKHSWPWAHSLLMGCTPYDYDYSLEAGTRYTTFKIDPGLLRSNARQAAPARVPFRCGVIICYESTIPGIARKLTLDRTGHKQIQWLVNISNDGWFIRYDQTEGTVTPSAELVQHMAVCVFRAVENRTPILRSVNGGISCLIDSCGRIRSGYEAASPGFREDPAQRQAIAGWFVDEMPIDSRVTLFSRYGQWLDIGCQGLSGLAFFYVLINSIRNRRRRGK